MLTETTTTQVVLNAAFKVHSALGPGLLESAYQECLYYELRRTSCRTEQQKPLPLIYNEVQLDCGYRVDLFIDQRLIVEIKSVEALNDIHLAQILTYLRLAHCRVGLLLNFNVVHLREGIRRVVNDR